MKWISKLIESAVSQNFEKPWMVYIPLTIWIVFLCYSKINDIKYWDFFLSNSILAIHESGHVLFSGFGTLLAYLGGTIIELLFPTIILGYFLGKKRFYDAAFVAVWLSYALLEVSVYMADAKLLLLPLITDGFVAKESAHDWYNIFKTLNLLEQSSAIAQVFKMCGYFLLNSATGIIIWLQIVMFLGNREKAAKLANQITV